MKNSGAVMALPEGPMTARSHTRMIRGLQSANKASLASVRKALSPSKGFRPAMTSVRDLWLIGAFAATVDKTAATNLLANKGVLRVTEVRPERLPDVTDGSPPAEKEYTYGLEKLGIPTLRKTNRSLTGKGMTAGVIDTGIDPDHPDLKGRVRLFHDFTYQKKPEPYDDQGHGTHVAGTIAGGNTSGIGIGVAPETTLIIAKVFDSSGSGSSEILLAAMQWMADPDGNPDTIDDVPSVVNNSWGGSEEEAPSDQSPYYLAVAAWRKLDIFPVFAAGNEGNAPFTISVPGAYPVSFAVGATDSTDRIANFSSVGPGQVVIGDDLQNFPKPDVSAPGVSVYSSIPGGKYGSKSGTSMATPHVTGAVVLTRQKFKGKKVEEIEKILRDSAKELGATGFDYSYGYGRIDVLKAISPRANRLPDDHRDLGEFLSAR
jgi:subtilisin family serine protease